ncbi:hypothetical protein [Bacillus sp. AFS053548]|uniref:hypothetical protein n=1 Tax=Bacillus sp. AFS053548 TaxID=2033505 RepID=UPI000BFCEDB4|nr:hypothetical protein [Bacillus sp. AFS053548]PGM53819.1 hypothetical protein CN946_16500 [Bacillus sp. AFS053548]
MQKSRVYLSLLLVSILLLTGCTSSKSDVKGEDKNIAHIKSVLTHQFTSDPELIKHIESGDSATIVGSNGKVTQPSSPSPLETYYKKMYGDYFTAKAYDVFVAAHAFKYTMTAENRGYTISESDVKASEVKGSKGDYDFTVNFVAKKDGEIDKPFTVTGRASVNSNGKITYMRYDDGDFFKAMQ